MEGMQFFFAAVSDGDGLYWSEIIWADGEGAAEYANRQARARWNEYDDRAFIPRGAPLTVHGPFTAGPPIMSERA